MGQTQPDFSNFFILNNIRFQIVSALFLLILELNYFKRRKLPIFSSFCFSFMMFWAAIYMVSDFVSVLSIVFMNIIPPEIATIAAKLYWFSKISIFIGIFTYVFTVNGVIKKHQKVFIQIGCVLYLYSLVRIFLGRVDFHRDLQGIYVSGSAIVHIYFISGLLLAGTVFRAIYISLRSDETRLKKKLHYIVFSIIIWIFTCCIESKYPELLISCVGIVMIVFLMYLGLENPAEFTDSETGALNYYAMKLCLQEKISNKQNFSILNVDMENISEIESRFGESVYNQLMQKIALYLDLGMFHAKGCKIDLFLPEKNSLTMIVSHVKNFKPEKIFEYLRDGFEKKWKVEKNYIQVKAHCDYIRVPEDTKTMKSIGELIDFIEKCHTYSEECCFVRRVNSKLLENKVREDSILRIVKDAIDNDGIEMYFQPIYNIAEGKFSNAEALVRLKDTKTLGFISPEIFIPMAEKNGLIMSLSDRIFNQIFDFMGKNHLENKGLHYIEMNLSGLQSVDADLPEQIKALLEKYGIAPSNVNLEITESMAVTSGYMLKKNMDVIKEMGITFSMDDFGTGYSNLSQMAKVDYELIKIDKSLLWPVFEEDNPDRENAKIILENMVKMILSLKKKIVVEGVETKEQFEYLKSLGATYIQGYYFSKPLCQADYLKFLEEKN